MVILKLPALRYSSSQVFEYKFDLAGKLMQILGYLTSYSDTVVSFCYPIANTQIQALQESRTISMMIQD